MAASERKEYIEALETELASMDTRPPSDTVTRRRKEITDELGRARKAPGRGTRETA